MPRQYRRGTATHFPCGCEITPENSYGKNGRADCRRCALARNRGKMAEQRERRRLKRTGRRPTPIDLSASPAVQLCRAERQKRIDRDAPAIARAQAMFAQLEAASSDENNRAQRSA